MAERSVQGEQEKQQAAQRQEDIRRGGTRPVGVMLFGVGLLFMLLVVCGGAWGIIVLYQGFHYQPAPTARPHPPVKVPYIRDWIQPVQGLTQERSLQSYRLHTYAWADRKKNIIHIPIERAMRMVAQQMMQSGKAQRTDVTPSATAAATQPSEYPESSEPLSVSHRSSGHKGQ